MEKSKSFVEHSPYEKTRYPFEARPKVYTFNGPSTNDEEFGSSGNPELKRKKRVASYNMFGVEAKLKSSLRNSFKWIKSKLSGDYYDV